MIRYLLDADIAVYAMTAVYPMIRTRLEAHAPGEVGISAITYAEVALSTATGKPPPQEVLDAFVAAIPIVPFDQAAAMAYADMSFRRARFDRLLAAHALSLAAVVVTNNGSDFADIPDLRVENWTQ